MHLSALRVYHKIMYQKIILLQILLYGDKNLPFEADKFILQATIMYSLRTERLT